MRALLTVGGDQRAAIVGQSVIESASRGTEHFPVDHAAAQLQSASSSYAWPKERRTELPIVQLGGALPVLQSERHHQAPATREGQSKAVQRSFGRGQVLGSDAGQVRLKPACHLQLLPEDRLS